MKIDNSLKSTAGLGIKEGTARPNTAPAAKPQTAPQDNVHITSLSSQMRAMEGGSAPEIDSARVEAIKQAISEGRFKINSGAIADGLIKTAKELVLSREN